MALDFLRALCYPLPFPAQYGPQYDVLRRATMAFSRFVLLHPIQHLRGQWLVISMRAKRLQRGYKVHDAVVQLLHTTYGCVHGLDIADQYFGGEISKPLTWTFRRISARALSPMLRPGTATSLVASPARREPVCTTSNVRVAVSFMRAIAASLSILIPKRLWCDCDEGDTDCGVPGRV